MILNCVKWFGQVNIIARVCGRRITPTKRLALCNVLDVTNERLIVDLINYLNCTCKINVYGIHVLSSDQNTADVLCVKN